MNVYEMLTAIGLAIAAAPPASASDGRYAKQGAHTMRYPTRQVWSTSGMRSSWGSPPSPWRAPSDERLSAVPSVGSCRLTLLS